MRVDVHQHLWTEPLVEALARRRAAPLVRRRDGRWRLELPAEEACELPNVPEDLARRATLLARDGIDRAYVALSPALGVDALPAEEADELLHAFAVGLADAGPGLGAWATVSLAQPGQAPAALDAAIGRGAAGLCVPAGALKTPRHVLRLGPLLERLEEADRPLFVHPGPDPWVRAGKGPIEPAWWAPMTGYVTEMHDAWHAWIATGLASFPSLRVVFALLAGGAPLHLHRLAARGAPGLARRAQHSPQLFYETSASGPELIEAVARTVGRGQLVHGSDRPVVEPAPVLPGWPNGCW